MRYADAGVQLRAYGVLCGRGEEHQGAACVPPAAPRWLARDPGGHAQVSAPHSLRKLWLGAVQRGHVELFFQACSVLGVSSLVTL